MIYLYGIVPADAPAPPPALRGLDDGAVRLLAAGPVSGVVGTVADEGYAEAELEARVAEAGWVGPRAAAHERVLTWFADRGPVVPLALFSLHRDEARARARLEADAATLAALLDRLRGHREWLVRLWRDADAPDAGIDEASPALQALSEEIAAATPGRRYLLERKRGALRAEERGRLAREAARRAYEDLAEVAARSAALPPPGDPSAARQAGLHSAFLVDDARFDAFRERVASAAEAGAAAGLRLEFTGPWPPYHFARTDAR